MVSIIFLETYIVLLHYLSQIIIRHISANNLAKIACVTVATKYLMNLAVFLRLDFFLFNAVTKQSTYQAEHELTIFTLFDILDTYVYPEWSNFRKFSKFIF